MPIFELFMEPITYIRFITQFSPILFSFIAVIDSAYNTSLKGILYVFGVLLTFSIGKLLSASFPFRVPGIEDGMKERDFGSSKLESDKYAFKNPKFHPSCNLLSKPDHAGWGTFYSSPDMYALFYSFTIIYIISSMMGNNDVNIFILTILIFFFILSSYFRTQVFYCVQFRDILIGLIIGSFLGFLWYIFVSIIEKSLKVYDLTYFNTNKENNDKCKMENKQFRCKKRITNVENDNKISQLQAEANSMALAAVQAGNAINNSDNFKMIWNLYSGILNKGKKIYGNLDHTKKQSATIYNVSIYERYSKLSNNNDRNLSNNGVYFEEYLKDDPTIDSAFDEFSEKIYGYKSNKSSKPISKNYNRDVSGFYLKSNNNNYKYIKKDGIYNPSSTIDPTTLEILTTNHIYFETFIKEVKKKDDGKPFINKIFNEITNFSPTFPITILQKYITNAKDYAEFSQYILNT